VEGLELASYFLALDKRKLPPVVLDDHNAEYRLQEEAFALDRRYPQRWLGAFYSWMQWHKLLSYEKAACRRAQAVIAVSEEDRQALLQLNTQLDVTVVPNGVDVEYYQNLGPPPAVSDLNLLFTGTMDFRPNVDAVVWFCQDVLPRIQRHVSHLRFLIVGQSPNATVRRLIGPGVVVTGAVPDVRPYMAQASVYVVPMRIGSGVRLKALEAMAYGIPVVSTKVGVQGIAVTPSRHFLLADRAQEFAAQVVKLLTDSSRRQSLAQEAQKLLRERYDWQVIVPRLEEVYLRVRAGAYL
ncbi:MAG: glycosyltransferase, partial [Chloroflexi bacterium]|nr:glycosyltransferase [Chloroflexota bacterium]